MKVKLMEIHFLESLNTAETLGAFVTSYVDSASKIKLLLILEFLYTFGGQGKLYVGFFTVNIGIHYLWLAFRLKQKTKMNYFAQCCIGKVANFMCSRSSCEFVGNL